MFFQSDRLLFNLEQFMKSNQCIDLFILLYDHYCEREEQVPQVLYLIRNKNDFDGLYQKQRQIL